MAFSCAASVMGCFIFTLALVDGSVIADGNLQIYKFNTERNATSWEFQLNTPLDPAAVNTTQRTALAYFTAFGSRTFAVAGVNAAVFLILKWFCLRYWHVSPLLLGDDVRSGGGGSETYVLFKLREWVTGSRANTTDFTLKIKHINDRWLGNRTLPPFLSGGVVANVTQKFENDVHCSKNGFSVSITNRDLPASANPDNFTTLADVVPYFSANLASYLNISSDAALNQTKHGEALLSKAKVKFIIQEKGELVEMKSKATYMHVTWWAGSRSSSPPIGVGAELSLRVKRAEASDGGSAEQSALATTQALFTSMVNSTIDNNSCVPPAL
eukprot:PhM_4_TR16441/c0_g1_i2/m.1837